MAASSCEEDVCWVCLEGANESLGTLEHPCSCPRGVHAKCLARWQLQSAGREEERHCRFCKSQLPDWRDILKPKVPAAAPVMAIVYDGKVVRLQVKPGREGMEEFQRQVRAAFGLGEDVELDCVFDCRAPCTGEKIKLRGLESYSAAMHCAAVAAGERLARMGGPRGAGGCARGSSGGGASGASGSSCGGGASSSGGCGGSAECAAPMTSPRTSAPGPATATRAPASPAPQAAGAAASGGGGGGGSPHPSRASPLLSRALAACRAPASRRGGGGAGYDTPGACGCYGGGGGGGGGGSPAPVGAAEAASPGTPSGQRRRGSLVDLFRNLSASKRVL